MDDHTFAGKVFCTSFFKEFSLVVGFVYSSVYSVVASFLLVKRISLVSRATHFGYVVTLLLTTKLIKSRGNVELWGYEFSCVENVSTGRDLK